MVINIKTIKCEISNQGIDSVINKLKSLKSGLKEADNKIVAEMGNFVKDQVAANLAATPYKDGNEDTIPFLEITGNKAKAGMRGIQSVYNEFGTGTKGQNSPHPEKSKFSLNDYNSGRKIKVSQSGNLFWIYKNKSGEKVITQGIPAGKQVFNASILLKGKKNEIIRKRVGEVISKL